MAYVDQRNEKYDYEGEVFGSGLVGSNLDSGGN